ncbi:6-bladed beta-propeller [Bacteroides sp. 519]|uniref:6-bladed beta-propeller n=1 Tax=Bacteroides sp. 519 TaxID=2302937 RepID=UPI0013D5A2F1|nr:6-bladed beta-propeller [Bacteroides sp. 519]NDV57810.1 6-bladed beta-propeller [Bacteroides sp. 519]
MRPLLILILLLVSCKQEKPESNILIFEPQKATHEFKLSDFVESITYIQFDSTKIFAGFDGTVLTDDFIFLKTNLGILKYDRTGRFIQQIGGIGQGPMEYNQDYQITKSESGEKLFIHTYEDIILTYDFDGNFLNRIKAKVSLSIPNVFRQYNNQFYFFKDISSYAPSQPDLWLVIDEKGKWVSSKKDENLFFESSSGANYIWSPTDYNNSSIYWNMYSDTIYRINKSGVDAFGVFGNGRYRLTPQNESNRDGCLKMNCIVETNRFIFFRWAFMTGEWTSNITIYDKQNKTFKNTDKPIVNDIDGGAPLFFSRSVQINGYQYLGTSMRPEDLKEKFLASNTPESRALAETIDEEGNPVMVLYKLKEQ